MFIRLKHSNEGIIKDILLDRRLLYIAISLMYAAILTSFPLMEFQDRGNYLTYARSSDAIFFRYFLAGIDTVVFNEPIWLSLNIFLGLLLEPENIMRLIIFIPSFTVSYLVLKTDSKQWVWLLLIILMPSILKNHITHLRQGVAISLFLVGWFSDKNSLKAILYSIVPFIHASFFFVIVILLLKNIIQYFKLDRDLKLISITISLSVFAVISSFLVQLTGARQADRFQAETPDVSGIGFLMFFFVFGLYYMEGSKHFRKYTFEYISILMYLSTYFFFDVTARIFESVMIPVLLSGLYLTKWRKNAYLLFLVFYFLLQWLRRFVRDGAMF